MYSSIINFFMWNLLPDVCYVNLLSEILLNNNFILYKLDNYNWLKAPINIDTYFNHIYFI